MTTIYFTLEILLYSHGRQAIQLRPLSQIAPGKFKIEMLLKLDFIFKCEVILCLHVLLQDYVYRV